MQNIAFCSATSYYARLECGDFEEKTLSFLVGREVENILLNLSLCASICVAGCTSQHCEESELLYRHRYYWENYSIIVSDWMREHSWSLGSCVIEVSEGKHVHIDFQINGRVENSWVTDLDRDGDFEVIVFTKCAGSGGFGEAFVYEWDEIELEERKLPPLSSDEKIGYMGHDIFKVEDNCLIREFPIYREGDANCCPKGGRRKIIYSFRDNVWKSMSRVKSVL